MRSIQLFGHSPWSPRRDFHPQITVSCCVFNSTTQAWHRIRMAPCPMRGKDWRGWNNCEGMFIIQGISSALGTGYESRTHDHGVKVRGLTAWRNPHCLTVFAWTVRAAIFCGCLFAGWTFLPSFPRRLSFLLVGRGFFHGTSFSSRHRTDWS